jgi:hypothetical protein
MPVAAADRLPSAAYATPSSTPSSTRRAPVEARTTGQPPAPSPFARMVGALGREADRGEATVRGVLAGGAAGTLGPSELLALQAGIYRYGETVDLAAKLVDKATTDLKTVLQGQQ